MISTFFHCRTLLSEVINNTSVSVDLILEKMAEGETIDDLLAAYPRITKEAIFACLAYASDSIKSIAVYPIERCTY